MEDRMTNTCGYRVVPINEDVATEVRVTGKAPGYGHPAHREVATGYGPCRLCLEPLRVGEDEALLFTYDPFAPHEPFPLPSPIYIHADPCTPYDAERGFPDALRFIPMTLNAYGAEARLIDQIRIENGYDGRVEEAVTHLLANPQVTSVHIRNTSAGCFIAAVEPVRDEASPHVRSDSQAAA
jgi:hypothetical protein